MSREKYMAGPDFSKIAASEPVKKVVVGNDYGPLEQAASMDNPVDLLELPRPKNEGVNERLPS